MVHARAQLLVEKGQVQFVIEKPLHPYFADIICSDEHSDTK